MTSIIQFSDVHFGEEDRSAMAAVASTVEALKPDVTVICGDITQNGKTQEFHAAKRWIESLSGPKIITPGNHDTPMFGLFQRFFDPFGRYKKIIEPLSEPYYFDEHVSIVGLNTSRGWQAKLDWSLGVVSLDDLNQAIRLLHDFPSSKIKMLAVHHPFLYPPDSPLQKETDNGAIALKTLSENNIDAVLSGHVHVPFFLERQPDSTEVLSIGAGTLSTRRRNKPASFNHIIVDSDVVKVTEVFWADGQYLFAEPMVKQVSELRSRQVSL